MSITMVLVLHLTVLALAASTAHSVLQLSPAAVAAPMHAAPSALQRRCSPASVAGRPGPAGLRAHSAGQRVESLIRLVDWQPAPVDSVAVIDYEGMFDLAVNKYKDMYDLLADAHAFLDRHAMNEAPCDPELAARFGDALPELQRTVLYAALMLPLTSGGTLVSLSNIEFLSSSLAAVGETMKTGPKPELVLTTTSEWITQRASLPMTVESFQRALLYGIKEMDEKFDTDGCLMALKLRTPALFAIRLSMFTAYYLSLCSKDKVKRRLLSFLKTAIVHDCHLLPFSSPEFAVSFKK